MLLHVSLDSQFEETGVKIIDYVCELNRNYTVYQKKHNTIFDDNFGICRWIFKLLSLTDSWGNYASSPWGLCAPI